MLFDSNKLKPLSFLFTIFLGALMVNSILANKCPEQVNFFKNYQSLSFGSKVNADWPSWENNFTEGYLFVAVWAKFFNIAPKNQKLKHSLFTIQSESNHKSNVYEWSMSPVDHRMHLLYNGEDMASKSITSSISGTKLLESKWFLTYIKRDRFS